MTAPVKPGFMARRPSKHFEWVETDPLEILKDLSDEQRDAVKWAFKRWVQVAHAEGYNPIGSWTNFGAEVDHSSLLNIRLLQGHDALEELPAKEHSYPVYPDLMP